MLLYYIYFSNYIDKSEITTLSYVFSNNHHEYELINYALSKF